MLKKIENTYLISIPMCFIIYNNNGQAYLLGMVVEGVCIPSTYVAMNNPATLDLNIVCYCAGTRESETTFTIPVTVRTYDYV